MARRRQQAAVVITPQPDRGVTPKLRLAVITGIATVRESRRLWLDGWRPIVEGINEVSWLAWEQQGSPLNIVKEPDWKNHAVYTAFKELFPQLLPELATFLDEHGDGSRWQLLSISRKIGRDRDKFYAWVEALSAEELEGGGHPRTLWNKYQKTVRKNATDDDNDNDDDDDDNEPDDEVAELDRVNTELKATIDLYEAHCRWELVAINDGTATLELIKERLLRLPFVHDPEEDIE
jgi:hypothetical protein